MGWIQIDGKPGLKYEIRLSTILREWPMSEIFTIRKSNDGATTIKHDGEMPLYTSCCLISRYLDITGIGRALKYPPESWDKGIFPFLISYEPFPSDITVPEMKIASLEGQLFLSESELGDAIVKPSKIFFDEDEGEADLMYDFLRVKIKCNPCEDDWNYISTGNKKRIELSTVIPKDQPRYEEFVVVRMDNGASIAPFKTNQICSSAGVVYNYLEITGLDEVLKEDPPTILRYHDGKRFTHVEQRYPDELRIVLDPLPVGQGVPQMYISPLENRLFIPNLSLAKAKQKPALIFATSEHIDLEYPFLRVSITYKPDDKELKRYFGDSLKLE